MMEDPEQKIGRPRQLFAGSPGRSYAPLEERG
jgi:citrate synthase